MTELSLYAQAYYDENKGEILGSSRCGNAVALLEISNYIYHCVKASEYTALPDDSRDIPQGVSEEDGEGGGGEPLPLDEALVQTDLDELRSGVFNRYAMNISQFKQIDEMQLTAGEWYDPYTFERWYDTNLAKERWRLTLTREGTEALSIKVLNDDGSYWYTPGAFIDQGDGTWLINSWDGAGSTAGQQVNYVFIYGSAEISQALSISGDAESFDSHIAYGASETPPPTGGTWVDSGETVTQLYGANTVGVTDSEPFPAGTPIRINDIETFVSYVHSPGILVLDMHIPASGGEVIYIQN